MYHLSVCIESKSGRNAFVISANTELEAIHIAESFPKRIGYCGNTSFAEAVKRAGMMERNEQNAWGIVTV